MVRITRYISSIFSFVSVVHLLVGVTYCLISWSIGLPKRAVSSFMFFIVQSFLHNVLDPMPLSFHRRVTGPVVPTNPTFMEVKVQVSPKLKTACEFCNI